MEAYFKYLHHPREAEGVDFWWIDWQQGSNCKVEGLDPLWIFNHFHYLDNKRDGRRPMTFRAMQVREAIDIRLDFGRYTYYMGVA